MRNHAHSLFARLAALVLFAALQLDVLHAVSTGVMPFATQEIAAPGYDTPNQEETAHDASVCLRQALRTRAALAPAPEAPSPAVYPIETAYGLRPAAAAPRSAARPGYSVYCVYRI